MRKSGKIRRRIFDDFYSKIDAVYYRLNDSVAWLRKTMHEELKLKVDYTPMRTFSIYHWMAILLECSLGQVNRERNHALDILSNKVHDSSGSSVVYDVPPQWLIKFLHYSFTIYLIKVVTKQKNCPTA